MKKNAHKKHKKDDMMLIAKNSDDAAEWQCTICFEEKYPNYTPGDYRYELNMQEKECFDLGFLLGKAKQKKETKQTLKDLLGF